MKEGKHPEHLQSMDVPYSKEPESKQQYKQLLRYNSKERQQGSAPC